MSAAQCALVIAMFLLVNVGDFLRIQQAEAMGFRNIVCTAAANRSADVQSRAEWLISDAAVEQESCSLRQNDLIAEAFNPQAIKSPIGIRL